MKIVLYSEEYKNALDSMLRLMSMELFGEPKSDIDRFVKSHWAIYICIDDNNKCLGFSSYTINDYMGLRDKVLGNTYIFIKEKYRRTKAYYMLALQTGKIVEELNIPVEHYYASVGSEMLSRKLSGKKEYTTYIYEPNEVLRVFNNLRTKIKIKD